MAKRPPIGQKLEGRLRKTGPEAKLKAYAIGVLKESGLLWWRNQSGAVRVSHGPGRTYMVRMGTPGLSDLMLVGKDGKLYCIELKAPNGRIRPEQRVFFARCKAEPFELREVLETNQAVPGNELTRVVTTAWRASDFPNVHIRCFFARSEDDINKIVDAAKNGSFINEYEYQR